MIEQNDTGERKPLSDGGRRRLIVACGSVLVSGLAGCVGGARDPGDGARNEGGAGDGGSDNETQEQKTPETPDGGVLTHLAALGLEEGTDYEPDGYAVVVYSESETEAVREEAEELGSEFDRYGTHGGTMVEEHDGATAVVSVWDDKEAADTAKGFLMEIDGVFESVSGPLNGTEGRTADGSEEGEDTPR